MHVRGEGEAHAHTHARVERERERERERQRERDLEDEDEVAKRAKDSYRRKPAVVHIAHSKKHALSDVDCRRMVSNRSRRCSCQARDADCMLA